MKNKLLVSSFAMIALLTSIVAGSTYALFTSDTTQTISVTTAKVEYVALLDETSIKTYSFGQEIGTDAFENTKDGESAISYDSLTNVMSINNMSPGDEVRFNVDITNNSSIITKYRVVFEISDLGDGELSNVLEYGLITTTDESGTTTEKKVSSLDWTTVDIGVDPESVTCYISLPEKAGNEYQSSGIEVKVIIESIQGNADTESL